ncbi:serine/threonine-protein kinase PAK 3-like [Cinclus cinclus]|uniref:serine/threonine-protein kinase PAK 3-like n=1 Tax=Cinclus cinclus TaxID=127875 RepID=UPI002E0DB127
MGTREGAAVAEDTHPLRWAGTKTLSSHSCRPVAIKKINLHQLRKRELKVDELRVIKKNRNPNLVKYLDCYLVDKQFWLVMEYMDGGTLSNVISWTFLSEDEMAAVSRQCLQGLDFLLKMCVIHQNVKSRNITDEARRWTAKELLQVKLSVGGISRAYLLPGATACEEEDGGGETDNHLWTISSTNQSTILE